MSVSVAAITMAMFGLLVCLATLIASVIRKRDLNLIASAAQGRQRISVQPVSPLPVYVPPTIITPTPAAQSVSYPQLTVDSIDEAPAPAYQPCQLYTPMPVSPSTPATTSPPIVQITTANYSDPPAYTPTVAP
ncbi:MAG: hypothetical protein JOS17DRAFT_736058 [Linnemannia elongata]|nr:MAG: hypothetical protein JOS17DRAFT_736058 [Linnemannia elongata]